MFTRSVLRQSKFSAAKCWTLLVIPIAIKCSSCAWTDIDPGQCQNIFHLIQTNRKQTLEQSTTTCHDSRLHQLYMFSEDTWRLFRRSFPWLSTATFVAPVQWKSSFSDNKIVLFTHLLTYLLTIVATVANQTGESEEEEGVCTSSLANPNTCHGKKFLNIWTWWYSVQYMII